jgi:predicted nucleic acid-binding protein
VILADAGPLVALLDDRERHHLRCAAVAATIAPPMVTTWPAFTEAMYLLGRAGGWYAQARLWVMLERGTLQITELTEAAVGRMRALMEQYRDLPMDIADASLVALAEERGLARIFTLDSDFRVYRLPRGRAFTIVP